MDPPELMWAIEAPDWIHIINHIIPAQGGGFIAATTPSTAHKPIIRFDENGNVLWEAGFCGIGFAYWVEQLADGAIVATGYGSDPGNTQYGLWITKVSASGDPIWYRVYQVSGSIAEKGECIEPLPDGGFAVCGSIPDENSWLLRTDSQGDTLWTMVWDSGGYDRARRVVCYDGGLTVFVEGQGNPAPIPDNGPFLLRYDMDGDLLWVQEYEAEYGPVLRSGGSMCIDQYAGGYALVTAESSDFVHTDTDGNEEWREEIEGTLTRAGRSIDQTMDGGYIFCGWESYSEPPAGVPRQYYQRDAWLVKLDQMGLTQWHIIYGFYSDDTEMFHSAGQLAQGGYIVAGEYWAEGASAPVGLLVRYAPETGIEEGDPAPVGLTLAPASNPFTSSVTITCSGKALPEKLYIYDLSGRCVTSLAPSGSSFTWDGRDASGSVVPTGTYLIQGAVDGQVSSIRVVRL